MTKRFTEKEKWDDPWFRKLTPSQKCFWQYICDSCDNAGVWKIDMDLAEFKIGTSIEFDQAISTINREKERVKIFDDDKLLLIHDFVQYQVGDITGDNLTNLQKNSIQLINKYIETKRLVEDDYPILTGKLRVANKYRYIGKGIVKGKGKNNAVKNNGKTFDHQKHFDLLWKQYPSNAGKKKSFEYFKNTVNNENQLIEINTALNNYLESDKVLNGYIQNGSTWFNDWQGWSEKKEGAVVIPSNTKGNTRGMIAKWLKEGKIKYGEHVYLTPKEYEELGKSWCPGRVEFAIKEFDTYIKYNPPIESHHDALDKMIPDRYDDEYDIDKAEAWARKHGQ